MYCLRQCVKWFPMLFLAVFLMMIAVGAHGAAESLKVPIREIHKYGNTMLSMKGTDFLNSGFSYGDIVTVEINGVAYDMPVGSNYTDVDQGQMICRAEINPDTKEDNLILSINMGNMAQDIGLAEKEKTEEAPGYVWHYREGITEPVIVTISMKEAGGYLDQYMIHQLVRSEKREDYPDLTDAEYANFREITTTGMGKGVLYRTSSPVDPKINRNKAADQAMAEAGVKTILNLVNNEEKMRGYEGYSESYYSAQNLIALDLDMNFVSEKFGAGFAEGLRFLMAHEGPYLIHCQEGKDRTGFVAAVLECFMGATLDEVINDYMITFFNFYGVQPGTEQYDTIVKSNICRFLAIAFDVPDIHEADLAAEAEEYLGAIGLSPEEIDQLRTKLGTVK